MKSITNIFCIIGKPGAGKSVFLNYLFDNSLFINTYRIKRFVYGTTRKMKPKDINGITFHFFTNSEFDDIDPEQIIESRSFDNANTGVTEYYFTLKEHINPGNNYLGITSIFQYNEIKKWANITQLKNPTHQINIYPIYIQAPLNERINRLLKRAKNDNDIYEYCVKILYARYEYNSVLENRIIDKYDPRTCFIDHTDTSLSEDKYIAETVGTILEFITGCLEKQRAGSQ